MLEAGDGCLYYFCEKVNEMLLLVEAQIRIMVYLIGVPLVTWI